MYKLFAVNNTKKSDVRGYWKNNGHIYTDKIHVAEYKTKHALQRGIKSLFDVGELSAFYTSEGKGYIIDKTGKRDVLEHRRIYQRGKLSASEVKGIVGKFGGATIYKKSKGYIIEVYYN